MRNDYDFRNSDYSRPTAIRPESNSGQAITVEQARSHFLSESREDQLLITRLEVAAFLTWTMVAVVAMSALSGLPL